MIVTEKDYYVSYPDGYHATGDIWMGLPSHGLLKSLRVSGVIVTPACDLANCKTETVTYVPIVPLEIFFRMPEFLTEIEKCTNDLLESIGLKKDPLQPRILNHDLLATVKMMTLSAKKENERQRIIHAINFLLTDSLEILDKDGVHLISSILGSNWKQIKAKLIRNSYRSDIYYLPPDQQSVDWSPVPKHSVALLRYLITVPTHFLNTANSSDERDWPEKRSALIQNNLIWCSHCHETTPPLRALRLKDAFLSDLLTKIVSIYVRIGAPNMSHEVLTRIETEI